MKAILVKSEIQDYPQFCSTKLANHLLSGRFLQQAEFDNQYPGRWLVEVDGKNYEIREYRNLSYEVLNGCERL
jgi:hypothetical protein